MDVRDKIVVITGAASGIGRALAVRVVREQARHVVVTDIDEVGAERVASSLGPTASARRLDVSNEDAVASLVTDVQSTIGEIDLFCSNAGVLPIDPDQANATSAPTSAWDLAWRVNVMAHVFAARALLPSMIARKSGYFLHTVSAAGLLSQIGSAAYSTTKHAAIGFAESLAITHKDHGIKVSVLCPQAVETAMIQGKSLNGADVDGVISADDVANAAIEGLAKETFLILPHPSVAQYVAHKTANYDRWIGGMAKLRRSL